MKTKITSLLGAGLSLLLTFGSTHRAAAQPAEDPPLLFKGPVEEQTSAIPPRYTTVQQILSMNADGSNLRQLTMGMAGATRPSWSPDYRYIAFVRSGLLMVMEAKGEPDGARIFAVCPAWANGLDWAPDGLSIVFGGSSVLAPSGLWEVSVNPDTEEVGTPQLVREGACLSPSWSPDGAKIAFHLDGVVRVLDLLNGEEISFGRYSISPTWNATGDRIAFGTVVCDVVGKGKKATTQCFYEICTANPDATGWTRVTRLQDYCAYPAWSPDGTQLVFRSDVDDKLGMSLYGITIGSDTAILLYAGGTFPNWGP